MAESLAKRKDLYQDELALDGTGYLLDVALIGNKEEEEKKLNVLVNELVALNGPFKFHLHPQKDDIHRLMIHVLPWSAKEGQESASEDAGDDDDLPTLLIDENDLAYDDIPALSQCEGGEWEKIG